MLAAEDAYAELEADLQSYLDNYEATHDYDEYHFDLDEIQHDPYVLISILSALHDGVFTAGEVQGDLSMLTDDMLPTVESLVSGLWDKVLFAKGLNLSPQFDRILNSKKVSDHHAIIPPLNL